MCTSISSGAETEPTAGSGTWGATSAYSSGAAPDVFLLCRTGEPGVSRRKCSVSATVSLLIKPAASDSDRTPTATTAVRFLIVPCWAARTASACKTATTAHRRPCERRLRSAQCTLWASHRECNGERIGAPV
ncbi:Uncharacterised protein [Mycobacteroides abscessus subsp. abscessus]|nr:Uncharacterised protein [Mycobacteroides abscessus subsp. abscessus]